MNRRVVISGLGPITPLGIGLEPTWSRLLAGECGLGPIQAFDASGFDCRIAGQVRDFDVRSFVPKTYRKATKVMARDIELAVAAADMAARDAGLKTKGTAPDEAPSYDARRVGAHIGAGLIAADIDELASALTKSINGDGRFDIHKWGSEGMNHLTPLWLLKYLPNMLACHVTIIHDARGPSNTITCAEASGGLSVGESLRVIQRGQADLCFCGGADSKMNPMAYLRQQLIGLLNTSSNDAPEKAVRPFDQAAAGMIIGEGGGIIIIEAMETYEKREGDKKAYAEVLGFAASQSVNRAKRNREPEPDGRGIGVAITRAIKEAGITPDAIDLIVPYGIGHHAWDNAEAAALNRIFGGRLKDVPVISTKPALGNIGAGSGGIDIAIAAQILATQQTPPVLNRDHPLAGLGNATASGGLKHALVYSAGFGGQNTALVLKRFQD